MLKFVLTGTVLASALQAGCIAVEGSQITAGELAKVSSEFATLDPTLVFSFAPRAGSQRIIPAPEMQRWAVDHGLAEVPMAPACFERVSYTLTPEVVSEALQAAIGTGAEDLHIDIIDICPCKIPAGRLEFTLSGASRPPVGHPETPVLWRGRLLTSDGRVYPVWVRARVTASVTVVRTTTYVRSGRPLRREDLEQVKISDSPLRFPLTETVTAYEGKLVNVSVPRGTILRPDAVHAASDVERGSLVKVDVVNGGAHLVLSARAETAGNAGDVITLTNPTGAARFRASVVGPGRAEVSLSQESLETARTAKEAQPE